MLESRDNYTPTRKCLRCPGGSWEPTVAHMARRRGPPGVALSGSQLGTRGPARHQNSSPRSWGHAPAHMARRRGPRGARVAPSGARWGPHRPTGVCPQRISPWKRRRRRENLELPVFVLFRKTSKKAPYSIRGVAKHEGALPILTFRAWVVFFDTSSCFLRIQVAILTPPDMKFT